MNQDMTKQFHFRCNKKDEVLIPASSTQLLIGVTCITQHRSGYDAPIHSRSWKSYCTTLGQTKRYLEEQQERKAKVKECCLRGGYNDVTRHDSAEPGFHHSIHLNAARNISGGQAAARF